MDFHVSGQDVDESMELRDAVIESALCVADYARSKGLDTEICYTNRFGERRNLGAWDEAALLNLVAEMPQATGDELVKQQTIEHVQQIALNRQAQNNVVVCTANVGTDMVGTVIMARQSRKNPFMVCAVPHRLVDRDLERHVVQLGALDDYRIGYQVISASDDLQGRDLS